MEVRIKDNNGYVDADWTIEDGIMVVSPKVEKFEPKDGDVISSDRAICIFKKEYGSASPSFLSYVALVNEVIDFGLTVFYKTRRPATEEEKKLLLDKLKEVDLAWDAEKKEVVKIKWKPKYGGRYYYPSYEQFKFCCDWHNWDNDEIDDTLYNKGVVFKTEAECQAIVDKLNQAIKGIKS